MKTKKLIIALNIVAILLMNVAPGHAEGEKQMIAIGEPFVEFDLEAHDGTRVSSAALEGNPYLLFFYPKADTPG